MVFLSKASLKKLNDVDYGLLAIISAFVYLTYALAFPISQGRDFGSYFIYYYDLSSSNPAYHFLMLFRTIGTPVFFGIFNSIGGSNLVEIVMGILYVVLILMIYQVVKNWNVILALIVVFLIYINLKFNILFHSVGSDSLFAFGIGLWVWFLFKLAKNPSNKMFIWHGFLILTIVLIKPVGQIIGLSVFAPFLFKNLSLSKKFKGIAVSLMIYLVLLTIYCSYNFFRYQDFAVSRGGQAFIPLYRLFSVDKLVRPENGPKSLELSKIVSQDLLAKEPYNSYNIDKETFFAEGDPRAWADLVGLSDRVYGWESDYNILSNVSRETIIKYPKNYFYGVSNTLLEVFEVPKTFRLKISDSNLISQAEARAKYYQKVEGLNLFSNEDQLIPRSYFFWLASNPQNEFPKEEQIVNLNRGISQLNKTYPPRDENGFVKEILVYGNMIYRHFETYKLLLTGLFLIFFINKERERLMLFSIFICLLIIVFTYLSMDNVVEYRLSFDPVFIMTGLIGCYNVFVLIKNAVKK